MNTGREQYNGTIPPHKVIYLRHVGNKLQVSFNYQLIEETDTEGNTLQNLQFEYVQVPDITLALLQDAQVPQAVVDDILIDSGSTPWHEEKALQIIFTIAQMRTLLAAHPELARHTVLQYMNYYVENGKVYIYARYLLPDHEQLITAYGGIINTK